VEKIRAHLFGAWETMTLAFECPGCCLFVYACLCVFVRVCVGWLVGTLQVERVDIRAARHTSLRAVTLSGL
jgi:hypothetical protein